MTYHLPRNFEVSNPRKSYAGPTVYRISCKVMKGYADSEVVDEVIVWRRFSEFKKLHKDLSKANSKITGNVSLPLLPKTTYFDRFDEVVIEERRKNILSFLQFVSEIPQLAKHECLDKFLGGGIYTSNSTSSSRTSSFSGSEGDMEVVKCNIQVTPPDPGQEAGQGKASSEELPQGSILELGGVWLCKQPSLVEGLDTAGNDDNTVQEQTTPTLIQQSLSFVEHNDVFTVDQSGHESSSSEEEDKTSGWLQRAISLCSEGEDIETLASEAENSQLVNGLSFPKPFTDGEVETSDSETSRELTDSSSLNDPTNCSDKEDTTSEQGEGHEPCRFLPQQPSFDCSADDYLVAAASIVRDALSCELDGQYKESFHLYKKCVSLLLHGVQEEKDSRRRDAVRRKTAQYLLKAEALYTAYVHETTKVAECTHTVSKSHGQTDDNEQGLECGQLQLGDFTVIGIIGKVLSKNEGHRQKSRRSKRRKHYLKAAYSKCPFIVELHQHCETETAVFLLLSYARGGLVKDHLTPVNHHDINKSQSYVHNAKDTQKFTQSQEQSNINNYNKRQIECTQDKERLYNPSVGAKIVSPESSARVWMAEIVMAVSHLHQHGIICRDLNLSNVLLSDSGHVKLTHFSVWYDVNEELDVFSLKGEYCAPELFKLGGLTKDSDWWSVGALFFEMLVGECLSSHYPWGIKPHTQIEIPSSVSTEGQSLIKQLLVVTPSERLGHGVNGVDNIQSHPFFKGINWKLLQSANHYTPAS